MSKKWHYPAQYNSRKESEKPFSLKCRLCFLQRVYPPPSARQTLEKRVRTGSPAQGQKRGMGRWHRYLSGHAGCIWSAVRPGKLGARRPSSALPSAASGAPPRPAAPQDPRGPPEAPAAPGRPPPVPPSARTGTRRCSWLRRAKGSGCESKGGPSACSHVGSG